MEPKCFRTKEYSTKSGICKRCRHYIECGNGKNSKFLKLNNNKKP